MSEQLSLAVGAVVRTLCAANNWSGRELARRAGLRVTATAAKLNDQSRFDLDDLDAIAGAFGLAPEDLIVMANRRRTNLSG